MTCIQMALVFLAVGGDGRRDADTMASSVIERLREHHWPGNVRELNSFLESYFILVGDGKLDDNLFAEMFQEHLESARSVGTSDSESLRDGSRETQSAADAPLKAQLDLAEKRIIESALIACNNDRKQTAKQLGIGATTLWRKCQNLGIR